MSSSTSPAGRETGIWPSMAPYVIPPVAASSAIVPVFSDMVAKSALQKGLPLPSTTLKEGIRGGLTAAPTVGAIVGTQMIIQGLVEKALIGESGSGNLSTTVASSAVVGFISAPLWLFLMARQWAGLSEKVFECLQLGKALPSLYKKPPF